MMIIGCWRKVGNEEEILLFLSKYRKITPKSFKHGVIKSNGWKMHQHIAPATNTRTSPTLKCQQTWLNDA